MPLPNNVLPQVFYSGKIIGTPKRRYFIRELLFPLCLMLFSLSEVGSILVLRLQKLGTPKGVPYLGGGILVGKGALFWRGT